MRDIDDRLDRLESQLEQQQETIEEQQRERNASLETRLDRIEAHLGIDDPTAKGVADD